MLSGFFFAVAVLRFGVTKWRETYINTGYSDIRIGAWWDWAMRLVVVEAVVLIVWWFVQVRGEGLAATLNPFTTFGIGSTIFQWAFILIVLLALNRFLVGRTLGSRGLADFDGGGGLGQTGPRQALQAEDEAQG